MSELKYLHIMHPKRWVHASGQTNKMHLSWNTQITHLLQNGSAHIRVLSMYGTFLSWMAWNCYLEEKFTVLFVPENMTLLVNAWKKYNFALAKCGKLFVLNLLWLSLFFHCKYILSKMFLVVHYTVWYK